MLDEAEIGTLEENLYPLNRSSSSQVHRDSPRLTAHFDKKVDPAFEQCQTRFTFDCDVDRRSEHCGSHKHFTGVPNLVSGHTKKMAAKLVLAGPISLTTPSGTDCTPKGQIRKAILAVLALSPRGVCSRSRLQGLFWGDSAPEKAAGSLRSALSALKTELGPIGVDVVVANNQTLTLNLGVVDVELSGSGEFLEGIDIGTSGAEGFEDWLRKERSLRETRLPFYGLESRNGRASRTGLGIVIEAEANTDQNVVHSARCFVDALVAQVEDWLGCPIYDYRNKSTFSYEEGVGPCILVRATVLDGAVPPQLHLRAIRSIDEKLIWSRVVPLLMDPLSQGYSVNVGQVSEQIVGQLAKTTTAGNSYHLLGSMFQLNSGAVSKTAKLMHEHWDEMQESTAVAMLAYLETLRRGETWTGRVFIGKENLMPMIRKVALDPDAPSLALAAAGYAAHYLAGEDEFAADLLTVATEMNASMPFCWDHLALLEFHCGNIAAARFASDRAMSLSRRSPLRYVYETTRAMIAFAENDFEAAATLGKTALGRVPNLSAAMRYASSSLGHLGRYEEAAFLNNRIRAYAPDFHTETIRAGDFRTGNEDVAISLVRGLRMGGLD